MKVQFGSALADEAKSNAYITIPGLRGMTPKEISVKNLAGIIQARMSEILDFVTYHLKQVGLENKMLNGGIILTGGGSQLKHVIQLAEYVTGLDARIGFPNEHLASGHIEELTRPMYATCIGLILKGYNVYENSIDKEKYSTVIPKDEKKEEQETRKIKKKERGIDAEKTKKRTKSLKEFMDSIKGGLIELFKEEGDEQLK